MTTGICVYQTITGIKTRTAKSMGMGMGMDVGMKEVKMEGMEEVKIEGMEEMEMEGMCMEGMGMAMQKGNTKTHIR